MPENDQLLCDDPERRRLLLESDLNGIDYIEVPFDDQQHIRVYFVKTPVPSIAPNAVQVEGGVRITGIDVVATAVKSPSGEDPYLEVTVDAAGDFSSYVLTIDAPGVLDPGYDHRLFGFKVGCPTDFDCLDVPDCPPDEVDEPVIDYMAKDYASFRRLLVDTIPSRVPEWTERHEADQGIALLELLAFEGDYISYAQDAVAQEMHLETARQRESVRRHAKLIDYPMHHGINAKAFLVLDVAESDSGIIPARSLLAHAEDASGNLRCPDRIVRFATRIGEPVDPASSQPPGARIPAAYGDKALQVADALFEPVESATVHHALNRIWIHTWGDGSCCLPTGSTSVDLVGDYVTDGLLTAGHLLFLEEAKGVVTGLAHDAARDHRQVVRISGDPVLTEDPLLTAADVDGGVVPRGSADPPLAVTRVAWDLEDALTFPLCVSTVDADGTPMGQVALARGNIVLVDHGVTVTERHDPDEDRIRYSRIGYRFRLSEVPLTFGFGRSFVSGGPLASLYRIDPRTAEPHVAVVDGDGKGFGWFPEPDLLGSDAFSRAFVVEPDNLGAGLLRFGDGTFGRQPSFPATPEEVESCRLLAIHRVGNGRQGNVGAETIVHVIEPEIVGANWPIIEGVRNPMPAWGGVDPEPIDLVKQVAPDAFRAETYRAVTEADYAQAAELLPTLSRAEAIFRWTGSWHTVFATVDPRGTDEVSDSLERSVRTQLTRYRQTGYDLEIDPPRFVPLEIDMIVCAKPDHFRSDVGQAVADAMSATVQPDRSRGFFHPDNFSFGQSLHLSEVYAAVERVPGVDSVEIVVFHRFGESPSGELQAGHIDVDSLEVIRLNNDPNFPENGVLSIEMRGEVMSIFDLGVGRCGCCEPPAPTTPEVVYNRPSLEAVAYRVGRFASFRQAMVQLVPDMAAQLAIDEGLAEPPLLRWTSRDSDDYGMALMEMWATIGDILTFYAERYANEAWLRTARDRDSIRRLAGLLGYHLKPGVAAGTHFAYRLDDRAALTMRAGLRAQSVPGEGEVPQKFETSATLDADSAVNWIPVYGPPTTVTTLAAGSSAETLTPGTHVPAVGDPVILFTGGLTGIEERTVAALEEVDGRPVLRWSTPLKSTHGRAHPRGRAFRLFGHSAPATHVYATPQGSTSAQSVRWDTATTNYTVTGDELDLDGTVDGLEVGSEVLVVLAGVARRRTVEEIEHVTSVVPGITGSASVEVMVGDATRITLSGSSLTTDRRTTRVYELGPRIEPLGWEVPQTPLLMGTTKLYVPYPEVEALADRRVVVVDDRSNDPMLLVVEGEAVPFTVGTVPEFLEVTLQSATTRDLDGASAHMLGNVVLATHGETVANEVIGDGDSSVALQEFTLAKSPVTHTSDPTAVGGARNSTEVMVDRVRWAERTGLFGAGASDRIYTTWIDDEQKMHVRFGDGRFGARLPTGRANVVATYRQGLGEAGNLPAGRIITALDKPAGVASVSNPFPATGGVDPESLDGARENAPNTVRTFDRAVSLRDFADLAREFAGVEKAFATWVWDGEERVVHVTVGGEEGAALSADQLTALRSFIDQRRDPNQALRIAEFRPVPFSVFLSVEADPDHFNEDIQAEVTALVTDYFAYDNRDFGQAVHLSDVYEVVHRAAGVVSAHITRLRYKLFTDRVNHGVPFAVVLVHAPIRGATHRSDSLVVGAEIATLESPSDLEVTVTGGLVR